MAPGMMMYPGMPMSGMPGMAMPQLSGKGKSHGNKKTTEPCQLREDEKTTVYLHDLANDWKYEHLRQFSMELNGLAVALQTQCQPETCTQMTATEQWIFLCAAHKTPKECPAIDYTRHTLDGAACLLNSNKYFPSRVSIKESSVAKLGSVCRRVYRIFSHAYYHHREIFDSFEEKTHLCRRFTVFVTKYNLMSKDNLIVPMMAELDSLGDTSITSASPGPTSGESDA